MAYNIGWKDVCAISEIMPFAGVATMVGKEQVAIFRLRREDEVYAISNFDPFSRAFVMANGIVGDRGGVLKVASPIYKHCFNLKTGECLDDPTVTLQTWDARVEDGMVQVSLIRRNLNRS